MRDRNVSIWLEFALQQMAAESYLDGIDLQDEVQVTERLLDGNNDTRIVDRDDEENMRGKSRFTEILANQFISQYLIVSHHANDASGFSSTLFFDQETFTYTLSFRSTEYRNQEFGGDYERDGVGLIDHRGADAEILGFGFALGQLLAMERYFKEVQASLPEGTRINVTGYSLGGHLATVFTELHYPQVIHTYTFNGAGRGDISGGEGIEWMEAERIRQMLVRLEQVLFDPTKALPNAQDSSETVALFMNAKILDQADPGWDPFVSGATENLYLDPRYLWARHIVDQEFSPKSILGGITRSDGAFAKITQIVGHATHGDAEYTADSQNHAAASRVFIEDQPAIDGFGGFFDSRGDFGTTHSITLIVDSLALQELFLSIDSTLSQGDVERMLSSSSAQNSTGIVFVDGQSEGNSLESALDALYKIVSGESTRSPFDRSTGGFGDIENRNYFYQRMESVRIAAESLAVPLKIELLLNKTKLELVAEALNPDPTSSRSVAFRYALKELNSFVVLNADYDDPNKWDLGDSTTAAGEMSEQWIMDRTALLVALNEARVNNRINGSDQHVSTTGTAIFSVSDVPEGRITIVPAGLYVASRFVTFDGEEGSHIIGGNKDDHLYGGDGEDILEGFEGQDWLEGGRDNDELKGGDGEDELYGDAGNDFLYGGDGSDSLHGGSDQDHLEGGEGSDRLVGGDGDDSLDGGTGNDRLEGGEGFDTYLYREGEGVDTIVDSDGLGRIAIDGRVIASPEGGYRRVGNVWMSEGTSDPYSFYIEPGANAGNVLVISGLFHGQIRVEGFKNGDFGILLDNASADVDSINPASHFYILTDLYGNSSGGRDSIGTSDGDNVVMRTEYGFFLGLGGNDVLGEIGNTLYGTDVFYGNGGDDLILGREVEYSDYGPDRLVGGGGADRILGGTGPDLIEGDAVVWFLDGRFRVDTFEYRSDVDEELGGYGLLYYPLISQAIEDAIYRFNGEIGEALHWILGTDESTDLTTYFSDYLDGGAGDDHIDGMSGSDQLYGGEGDDVLTGDSLVFHYFPDSEFVRFRDYLGAFGDDFLDGGDGNDNLSDYVAGNDFFLGGDGNDTLINQERGSAATSNMSYLADSLSVDDRFNNYLDGGDGDDSLKSVNPYGGSRDVLLGGNGNDFLDADGLGVEFRMEGGAGNDTFNMGWGSFTVDGGTGGDTYKLGLWYVNYAELSDDSPYRDYVPVFHISDWGPDSENQDVLEIGLTGSISDLQIYRSGDDLLLGLNARKDVVTVENWYRDPSWRIERIIIHAVDYSVEPIEITVTEWDTAQVESQAIWLGTDGPDLLHGEESGETINGADGDDVLIGGGGDDFLIGAGGNDIYRFGRGSGHDVVAGLDSLDGEHDSVVLEEGLLQSEMDIKRESDDLIIGVRGSADTLTLQGWFVNRTGGIESVKFSSGEVWGVSRILDMTQGNHAPVVTQAIGDQKAMEDLLYTYQVPEGLFYDEDVADTLTYSATLADGSGLPSWLVFDADTRTLSGTPLNANVGTISIRLSATDIAGERASADLQLAAENTNDSPTVLMALEDQVAADGTIFVFDMPDGSFGEFDTNDALVYTASLDSGSFLPSWLSFDSDSRRFSGIPSEVDIGSFVVRVTATDSFGASVSDAFQLIVNPHQDLHIVGAPGNQRLEGKSGNDTLDGGQGADVLVGKRGNDAYMIDSIRDLVIELKNEGTDEIRSLVTYTLPENVENLILTGASSIVGTGNSLDNVMQANSSRNILKGLMGNDLLGGGDEDDRLYGGPGDDMLFGGRGEDYMYGENGEDFLRGDAGSDYLYGGLGEDILQGGGEDDDLDDSKGRTLLDGGDGNDTLSGRKEPDLILGGSGDDTIGAGAGQNVIGFNLGDGRDVITRNVDSQNTISLGGGIAYSDLEFSGPNFDLILRVSDTDQITFQDWYRKAAYQNTTRLQIIAETMPGYDPAGHDVLLDNRVEIFDFAALAAAFDTTDRGSNWSLTDALLSAYLSGSDVAAMGGDLAYQYGLNGSLAGIGLTPALDVLKAPQFGTSAQTLRPLQDLQQGQIRLS